jgi:hypothetical protein
MNREDETQPFEGSAPMETPAETHSETRVEPEEHGDIEREPHQAMSISDDDANDEGPASASGDDSDDEDDTALPGVVESAFDDDPFARGKQTHANEAVQNVPTHDAPGEVRDDDDAREGDDDGDDGDDDGEDDPWDRAIDAMDENGPAVEPVSVRDDEALPEVSSEPAEIPIELIDKDALWVVKRLRAKGYEAYLTGGCVRDLLLGRSPKDFDVATAAHPNQVRAVFRNCRLIGRRFRLAHVTFPGNKVIETATFRANPLDLADDVPDDLLVSHDNVFGDVEQDAKRRDLTVNGLFYDPLAGKVIDYVDGRRDLEQRLIRTIGDPQIRFQEDPVRIIRAIKFATRLGFEIEEQTFAAMKHHVGGLARCAPARLQEELMRLLLSGHADLALSLCEEVGVMGVLLPEIESGLMKELAGRSERVYRTVLVPVMPSTGESGVDGPATTLAHATPNMGEPAPSDLSPAALDGQSIANDTEPTADAALEWATPDEVQSIAEGAPVIDAVSAVEAVSQEPALQPTVVEEWVEHLPLDPIARRARYRAHVRALDAVIQRGVDVDSAIAWATLMLAVTEAHVASPENAELWLDETGAAWTERIRFTRRDKDHSKILLLGLQDLAPERRVVGQTRHFVTRPHFRDLLLLHTIALIAAGEPLDEIGRWKAVAQHYGAAWRQPKRGERLREPRRHERGGDRGGGDRGGDRNGDRGADRGGDRDGGRGRGRRRRQRR